LTEDHVLSADQKSYGWESEAPHSHDYLHPVVLDVCKRIGAKKILDLGCGNGAMCRELLAAGYEVVGCDLDEGGVEIARRHMPGIPFHVLGVDDDPSRLGVADFDLVVSTEVVEHLFRPRNLPRFAHRTLKPGGRLLVTTPYHGYLKNLALALFDKWDLHHSPLWEGGHIKFWSAKTLGKLLESNGFSVESFQGVGRFAYFWKSMAMTAIKRD
jgi:2-polyprenyl-3-methyl-5-hydroxy-6-metoxy-1,4-benzoquinol methylase